MPYISYKKYQPKRETKRIVQLVESILKEYSAKGYQLTLRQLYYQMIARDLFPDSWIDKAYNAKQGLSPTTKNTIKNYKRLGDTVSNAREGGLLDWDHIIDRGRRLAKNSHWLTPDEFLSEVMPQYAIDRWRDQPTRVEVWVEKEALVGVVAKACSEWDVPYFACKGYTSSSAIWDAGHNRILGRYAQASEFRDKGQKTVILHLGDHDPSGIDMTRDISERLAMFSVRTEKWMNVPDIIVKRIALTMDQVRKYDPPPNPAKESDSRYEQYKEDYGEDCWELDALEPDVIVKLIQGEIKKIVDKKKFDAATKRESKERTKLMELIPRI